MGLTRYDIIGRDVERILHRSPARVWVECVERPVLRKKGESNAPSSVILQASAPIPVLGGGHVGADFQAGALVDKFVYHIPEYRQVKMYADAEVGLSTSTPNDWVHRAADKLYPLCETLIDAQRSHPHLAAKALEYIATLYMQEENLRSRGASGEEIREQRRTRALPLMDGHGSVGGKRAAPVHARRPAGQGAGVRLQVVAEDEEVTRMVTIVMPHPSHQPHWPHSSHWAHYYSSSLPP